MFVFFKQKTAYEMRISDWSSDVCSSELYSLREHVDMSFREPVLVFDIETIPDLDGGRRIMGLEQMNDAEVWAAMKTQRLAQKGNDFMPGHLQREIGRAQCRERVCQYV